MLTYSDIFRERGRLYHSAMSAHPLARQKEFELLFAARPATPGDRILDVPAGGGYLGQFLPSGVDVAGFELTEGFGAGVPLFQDFAGANCGRFDHAVCLAALHHIAAPFTFLRSLLSQLKPTGVLHVADVCAGSPVATFLDDFVGQYNVTGHCGNYVESDPAAWAQLGRVTRIREQPCPWRFPNINALLSFCTGLFGLVACKPALLQTALERFIGIHSDEASVVLEWRLLYVDIEPMP